MGMLEGGHLLGIACSWHKHIEAQYVDNNLSPLDMNADLAAILHRINNGYAEIHLKVTIPR